MIYSLADWEVPPPKNALNIAKGFDDSGYGNFDYWLALALCILFCYYYWFNLPFEGLFFGVDKFLGSNNWGGFSNCLGYYYLLWTFGFLNLFDYYYLLFNFDAFYCVSADKFCLFNFSFLKE